MHKDCRNDSLDKVVVFGNSVEQKSPKMGTFISVLIMCQRFWRHLVTPELPKMASECSSFDTWSELDIAACN